MGDQTIRVLLTGSLEKGGEKKEKAISSAGSPEIEGNRDREQVQLNFQI